MGNRKIRVLPTPQGVAEEAARRVIEAARREILEKDTFTIALAGGGTPRLLYDLLAREPFRSEIEWPKVEVFFGDERSVPPDHSDSNYRMAHDSLLSHVPVLATQVHRIRGEIEPEAAAIEYGRMLKARFGQSGLDLALLGMGADGHTASIFPRSEATREQEHRSLAVYVEKLSAWRVTLSPMFLNRSQAVLILVTGGEKAQRVQEVLEGDPDPHTVPIRLIDPPGGAVTFLLDAAAAGM